MTTFDQRDRTFENKFAHDEEMAFKVQARTSKLVGLWAANLLGKNADEAESYASQLVQNFKDASYLLEKLLEDFAAVNLAITSKEIRIEIAMQADIARAQIMGDAN